MTTVGAGSLGYDARGNLTSTGAVNYVYRSDNRLASASTGYSIAYDPLGRYHWVANGAPTFMQYDGSDIIEERMDAGVMRRTMRRRRQAYSQQYLAH